MTIDRALVTAHHDAVLPSMPLSRRMMVSLFFKYKGRIVAAFLVPVFLCLALAWVMEPHATARAVLMVRLGSEYVYQAEVKPAETTAPMAMAYMNTAMFNAELAILNSADLHQAVLEEIGVPVLYPSLMEGAVSDSSSVASAQRTGRALDQFRRHFDVTLGKESSVIQVSFRHTDARLAVKVVDVIVTHYQEKRQSLFTQPRLKLLEDQARLAEKKRDEARQALQDFGRSYNIFAFDDEREALLKQRADLEKRRMMIMTEALDDAYAEVNEKLATLSDHEASWKNLTHNARLAEDDYTTLHRQVTDAMAYEALEHARLGNVRVVQPALADPRPRDSRFLIVLMGVVGGFVGGWAVYRSTFRTERGFITAEDVEAVLGLPVLGVLSLEQK